MKFECPDGIRRIVISACERCPIAHLGFPPPPCPDCGGEWIAYATDSGIGGGAAKKGEWLPLTEIMYREGERRRKREKDAERFNSTQKPGDSPIKNPPENGSTASNVKPTSNSTGETKPAPSVFPP